MARQYALDSETTGLKSKEGDRMVELAIVEITRDPNPRFLHLYFNPHREVSEEAFQVHGLSNEFLSDKPDFADCIPQILEFLEHDSNLVIHNAPFDLGFLRDEFLIAGQVWPEYPVFDTLKAAIQKWPNGRHSLDALCNKFGIDLSSRTKHGGLIDTKLLAKLYLAWFGQGGFDLDMKTTIVSRADFATLGALNPLLVPLDEEGIRNAPPAKSWDEFFGQHAI